MLLDVPSVEVVDFLTTGFLVAGERASFFGAVDELVEEVAGGVIDEVLEVEEGAGVQHVARVEKLLHLIVQLHVVVAYDPLVKVWTDHEEDFP